MKHKGAVVVVSVMLIMLLFSTSFSEEKLLSVVFAVAFLLILSAGVSYMEDRENRIIEMKKNKLAEIKKSEDERAVKLNADIRKQQEEYIDKKRRADERRNYIETQKIENLFRKVESITNEHMPTLLLKHSQMVVMDDYGNTNTSKWMDEVRYFVDEVVSKKAKIPEGMRSDVLDIVIKCVKKSLKRNKSLCLDYSDKMSAKDYELYCANLLNQSGWNSRLTKGSGDQGVDIIAEHGFYKAVFQCKKYTRPVGNAAVQEVIAGMHYEKANVAAVVTNSTFTISARQLANTANIFLLHNTELPEFIARLSESGIDGKSAKTTNSA